jgi:RimJ/RimL family protein N-acetyltransferase
MDEPVGVAILSPHDPGNPVGRIDLAGIVAAERGAGRYAHLLHGVHDVLRQAGAREVVIATQAENETVQRAWARAGYRPDGVLRTVHLVRSSLRAE